MFHGLADECQLRFDEHNTMLPVPKISNKYEVSINIIILLFMNSCVFIFFCKMALRCCAKYIIPYFMRFVNIIFVNKFVYYIFLFK